MPRLPRPLLLAAVALGLAAPLAAQTLPGMPTGGAIGQPPPGREPPPQAYDDCRGKRAGEAIQHRTPQGMIAAKCMDSPKGLFARPDVPPMGSPPGGPPKGPPPGAPKP